MRKSLALRARIWTTVGAMVAATGAVGTAAIGLAAGPASAATLTPNWYAQAPYVMPTENNPPNLPAVMSATGEKAFMLAFILANGSSCSAAWDGTSPVSSDTAVAGVINGVRNAGGDVSVSIGGYGGTKLGQVCSSPSTTAAAYQAVISKYALKAIDLDLEEPEYENTTAVNNELGAAQILQRNNPGMYISITLPGTTAGTGWFGTQAMNTAKSLGFTPDNWTIMPFDGGFNGAGSQQSALKAFNGLLTSTFGWSAANAWAHEGISQMNGRSDTGEIFTQADFASNLSFAKSVGLGRFTNWSVNRDRQCPGGANSTTSGTCSSVVQSDWDFTRYSVQFAGQSTGGGTTTPPASGVSIVSNWNGKCIDVNANNWSAGVPLQVWTCNNSAAQKWTLSGGTVHGPNNQCLDVANANPAAGTTVQIATCSGNPAQQFTLNAANDLVSVLADKCVDINAWNGSDGAKLIIWTCTGGANQKWHQA